VDHLIEMGVTHIKVFSIYAMIETLVTVIQIAVVMNILSVRWVSLVLVSWSLLIFNVVDTICPERYNFLTNRFLVLY
jgi:hypothetical protein